MKKRSGTLVVFDQYPFVGGGQTVLLALAEAGSQVAERVALVIPKGGELEKEVRRRLPGVEMLAVPEPRLSHGRKGFSDLLNLAWYSIRLVLDSWGLARTAGILYGNGPRQFPGLMLLSILTGRRCCYHIHIDHGKMEKWLIWMATRLWTTHRVIVNSQFVFRRLSEVVPAIGRSRKVVIVENSLGPSYSGLSFIDRFSDRLVRLQVAVLGVLRPEKGQDQVIELARQNKNVHFHLIGRVGGGAENWVNHLKRLAPSNVTFHGPVSDVPSALSHLGIHVNLVPSRWEEPFGLVAIEGMACSCITIVVANGGLSDIASKTGAIACANVNEMSAALKRLCEMRPVELTVLARKQFEATLAQYAYGRFCDDIKGILKKALRQEIAG